MTATSLPKDDWDRHWDQCGEAAADNPAQGLRRKVIRSLLSIKDQPARVLDVGCGQGDLIAELHATYPQAELCGIDYSHTGVQLARRKVPGATFVQRDLLEAAEPPRSLQRWATHAVCSEVLEHVDDPGTLLQNAAGYMAPGCLLVITVPGGPMSAFDRHIGHRKHFTIDMLRGLLTHAGFRRAKVVGAGFPFFNLYRMVVIARGPRLVGDVATGEMHGVATQAQLAMRLFRYLFHLNLPPNRWGWQIVGVATLDQC